MPAQGWSTGMRPVWALLLNKPHRTETHHGRFSRALSPPQTGSSLKVVPLRAPLHIMGLTILNLGSPDFSYRMRENLDIPEEELLSKRLGKHNANYTQFH